MCLGCKWIVCVASCLSLIQSVIWTGLSVAAALVYSDVITVKPYKKNADFFPVTLVKLYFESPHGKIDGTYLGQFEKDYRNANVIDLLWPDKVFAICVAYVILNVIYFFVSLSLCSSRNPKDPNERTRSRDVTVRWSCLTYVICALDAVFVYFLLRDFVLIKDYVNKSKCLTYGNDPPKNCEHLADLPYIPLALAAVVGKLGLVWVWNVIVASLLFFDAVCCKKITADIPQVEKKPESEKIPQSKSTQAPPPVKLINKSYSTTYDVRRNRDASIDVRRAVEAVTSFSDDSDKPHTYRVYSRRDWEHPQTEGSVRSGATWHTKAPFKEWTAINEGYESDENESVVIERSSVVDPEDEPGQKRIKIVKPPIGKPADDAKSEVSGKAGSSHEV